MKLTLGALLGLAALVLADHACGPISDAAFDQLESACESCRGDHDMMDELKKDCKDVAASDQKACVQRFMREMGAKMDDPAHKAEKDACVSRQLSRMGASDEAVKMHDCVKDKDMKPTPAEMEKMVEHKLRHLQSGDESSHQEHND